MSGFVKKPVLHPFQEGGNGHGQKPTNSVRPRGMTGTLHEDLKAIGTAPELPSARSSQTKNPQTTHIPDTWSDEFGEEIISLDERDLMDDTPQPANRRPNQASRSASGYPSSGFQEICVDGASLHLAITDALSKRFGFSFPPKFKNDLILNNATLASVFAGCLMVSFDPKDIAGGNAKDADVLLQDILAALKVQIPSSSSYDSVIIGFDLKLNSDGFPTKLLDAGIMFKKGGAPILKIHGP